MLCQREGDKPQLFTLPLSDFKTLFWEIQKVRPATKIDIVLNGSWALAQFSELCNHRIRILPDTRYRRWHRFFRLHLYLEEKDFEFATSVGTFYGQRRYLTMRGFIQEEIAINGIYWILIFIGSLVLLYSIYLSSNSTEFLGVANDILIQIAAIFFTVFMLFTASQVFPHESLRLFRQGSTHRFLRVDILVAWFSLFALGLAALNKLVVESSIRIGSPIVFGNINVRLPEFLIPFTTALAVTAITMSLVTVVSYYFKRVEDLYHTDLSRKILDNAFEDRHSEQK